DTLADLGTPKLATRMRSGRHDASLSRLAATAFTCRISASVRNRYSPGGSGPSFNGPNRNRLSLRTGCPTTSSIRLTWWVRPSKKLLHRETALPSRAFERGQHAPGLVEHHIGLRCGWLEVTPIHLYMVAGRIHLEAHLLGNPAVDGHAPLADQLFGLPPRGHSRIGNHLLQPYFHSRKSLNVNRYSLIVNPGKSSATFNV